MRTSRLLSVLTLAVIAGCSSKPSTGGIQVQVVLAPGLKSACARVEVTSASGGAPLETGPIVLAGKSSPLVVGVAPTGQDQPVTVQAIGYSDTGCNSRTVPAEVSDTASGSFTEPVTILTVTLAPASTDGGTDGGADGGADAGVDQDGDGYSPPEDCDDTNPLIKPGVQELCADRLDNNCNQAIDCADSACDLQTCASGGGATCATGACRESACDDNVDNDGDGATDCADSDCANRACGVGGTCMGTTCVAPSEVNLCGDGLDNDNDTFIDCLDSDCPEGSTCSDVNACTMMDVCGRDGGCVPGTPKVCDMPPNTRCWDLAGTCSPDAGGLCEYRLNSGSTCDDGRACTKNDTCDADGGCVGAPVVCDMPPGQCFAAMGACSEALDGGCFYAPLATGVCSDGDNCTINDGCDGNGGCVGSPVSCAPSGLCEARIGCDADGGCLYQATPGVPCDAGMGMLGTCADAGVCTPTPTNVFPFTPSNFTEAQLPALAAGMTFSCGTTTLNTGSPGGAVTWTNNCSGNPTPTTAEIDVGSQKAVLIFVDSLGIAASSALRVEGDRPLIMAVRNNATIDGTLNVGSAIGTPNGAGANLSCTGAAGQNGSGGGTPETGGGGGGAAFGSNGANGANGYSSANGGNGGSATGNTNLVPLRGGCPGGNGGRRTGDPGLGGAGGGAVQLSVGGTLSIAATGRVAAAGAGGRGGTASSGTGIGGGGGGSGGGILLEGRVVTIAASGAVTANGGGGGQGGGISSTGTDGQNGRINSGTAAPGGDSMNCGGTGGNGAAGTSTLTQATVGGTETCQNAGGSGGGGGGGAGRIVVKASMSCTISASAVVSPAARGNGTTNGCPAP